MKDKEKQIFDKYGNYNFPTELKQDGLNSATTQIEEMAKDIECAKGSVETWHCRDTNCEKCEYKNCKNSAIAEELIEQGYRKLPQR